MRGKTSKNNGDCHCTNCPYSFRTENKLKSHESVCKDHDYCQVETPKLLKYENTKI